MVLTDVPGDLKRVLLVVEIGRVCLFFVQGVVFVGFLGSGGWCGLCAGWFSMIWIAPSFYGEMFLW